MSKVNVRARMMMGMGSDVGGELRRRFMMSLGLLNLSMDGAVRELKARTMKAGICLSNIDGKK